MTHPDPGTIFREMNRDTRCFEINGEHLVLLRRAVIDWPDDGYGAPRIHPKHPYGNSNVERDVVSIIRPDYVDINAGYDRAQQYVDEQPDKVAQIHAETGLALQIILSAGHFGTGHFVRDNSWGQWRRIDPPTGVRLRDGGAGVLRVSCTTCGELLGATRVYDLDRAERLRGHHGCPPARDAS